MSFDGIGGFGNAEQIIFRPFRANVNFDPYLGLKPQAESLSPFGTESENLVCTTATR